MIKLFLISLLLFNIANARDVSKMKAKDFDDNVISCSITMALSNSHLISQDSDFISAIRPICHCMLLILLKYEDEEILNFTLEDREKIVTPVRQKCTDKVLKEMKKSTK